MSELYEKAVAHSTTNVTLVTTTETVVISSGPAGVPYDTCLVHILATCQLTTGVAATAVTPRIRRGTAVTGALVGEGNAVTLGAAAGSTEQFVIEVTERRSQVASVEYSLTLEQTAATGNGTVLQAAIEVEVLSG